MENLTYQQAFETMVSNNDVIRTTHFYANEKADVISYWFYDDVSGMFKQLKAVEENGEIKMLEETIARNSIPEFAINNCLRQVAQINKEQIVKLHRDLPENVIKHLITGGVCSIPDVNIDNLEDYVVWQKEFGFVILVQTEIPTVHVEEVIINPDDFLPENSDPNAGLFNVYSHDLPVFYGIAARLFESYNTVRLSDLKIRKDLTFNYILTHNGKVSDTFIIKSEDMFDPTLTQMNGRKEVSDFQLSKAYDTTITGYEENE